MILSCKRKIVTQGGRSTYFVCTSSTIKSEPRVFLISTRPAYRSFSCGLFLVWVAKTISLSLGQFLKPCPQSEPFVLLVLFLIHGPTLQQLYALKSHSLPIRRRIFKKKKRNGFDETQLSGRSSPTKRRLSKGSENGDFITTFPHTRSRSRL